MDRSCPGRALACCHLGAGGVAKRAADLRWSGARRLVVIVDDSVCTVEVRDDGDVADIARRRRIGHTERWMPAQLKKTTAVIRASPPAVTCSVTSASKGG